MAETYAADLIDFLSDRNEDLNKILNEQLLEEESEFCVDFDDYSS
jgi:hypothetical protein